MAAHNSRVAGHQASNSMPGDFLLYPDNDFSNTPYREDFDADISALEEENRTYDSGYYSSPNLERNKVDDLDTHAYESSYVWCSHNAQDTRLCTNTAASITANHGSTFDGIANESTKTIEEMTALSTTAPKSYHREGTSDINTPSLKSMSEVPSPAPLQLWLQAYHHHESLACRLEQPAKRRKTARRS